MLQQIDQSYSYLQNVYIYILNTVLNLHFPFTDIRKYHIYLRNS